MLSLIMKSNALFENIDFSNQNFENFNITSSEFINCNFLHVDLSNSVLQACIFEECTFTNCVLNLAKFKDTTLSKVLFNKSHMTGFDFSLLNNKLGTKLNITGCNISYSTFINLNLRESVIFDCKVHEVSFEHTDLSESDLSKNDFLNSRFVKNNFIKSDFTKSRNYTFDVTENQCKNAKFSYPEVLGLLDFYHIIVEDE